MVPLLVPLLTLLILLFFPFQQTLADVIHLKNGRTLEGQIISQNAETVLVEIGKEHLTISKQRIHRISYSTVEGNRRRAAEIRRRLVQERELRKQARRRMKEKLRREILRELEEERKRSEESIRQLEEELRLLDEERKKLQSERELLQEERRKTAAEREEIIRLRREHQKRMGALLNKNRLDLGLGLARGNYTSFAQGMMQKIYFLASFIWGNTLYLGDPSNRSHNTIPLYLNYYRGPNFVESELSHTTYKPDQQFFSNEDKIPATTATNYIVFAPISTVKANRKNLLIVAGRYLYFSDRIDLGLHVGVERFELEQSFHQTEGGTVTDPGFSPIPSIGFFPVRMDTAGATGTSYGLNLAMRPSPRFLLRIRLSLIDLYGNLEHVDERITYIRSTPARSEYRHVSLSPSIHVAGSRILLQAERELTDTWSVFLALTLQNATVSERGLRLLVFDSFVPNGINEGLAYIFALDTVLSQILTVSDSYSAIQLGVQRRFDFQ